MQPNDKLGRIRNGIWNRCTIARRLFKDRLFDRPLLQRIKQDLYEFFASAFRTSSRNIVFLFTSCWWSVKRSGRYS